MNNTRYLVTGIILKIKERKKKKKENKRDANLFIGKCDRRG